MSYSILSTPNILSCPTKILRPEMVYTILLSLVLTQNYSYNSQIVMLQYRHSVLKCTKITNDENRSGAVL